MRDKDDRDLGEIESRSYMTGDFISRLINNENTPSFVFGEAVLCYINAGIGIASIIII